MTTNPPTTPVVPALARLFWMMIGPLVLILLTFVILQMGQGWLTAADIAFLAILAGVILARWLEFQGGQPQTATGEPATPAHLRRFIVAALPIGLGIWVIANLLGNHWLLR